MLSLDGTDDYAVAPDGPAYDLGTGATDDFTLETMFQVPAGTATQTGTLFFKNLAYDVYILFNVSGDQDRLIYRLRTTTASWLVAFYNVTLSEGWHHVAAVFDNEYTESGDLMALYLDGTRVASSSAVDWTPGIPNSSSALYVGGYLGINSFPGRMEEARISNAVRYAGGTCPVPATAFTLDANTVALWHFDEFPDSTTFLDSSGNGNNLAGANGAATYNDDATPPVTYHDYDGLWHNTFVTVDLSPVDNDGGSGMSGGLAKTEYSVDGGGWVQGTSVTFAIWKRGGGSGSHTLLYRSTDAVGNSEQEKSLDVLIDTTRPATTDDAPATPHAGGVTVHLTAIDPLGGVKACSGVQTTWYRLDGDDWAEGVDVSVPGDPGTHWIAYSSVDNAGNTENVKWRAVSIIASLAGPHLRQHHRLG